MFRTIRVESPDSHSFFLHIVDVDTLKLTFIQLSLAAVGLLIHRQGTRMNLMDDVSLRSVRPLRLEVFWLSTSNCVNPVFSTNLSPQSDNSLPFSLLCVDIFLPR